MQLMQRKHRPGPLRLQVATGILAGGFVGEEAVEFDTVQLAVGVLVGRADADVADALPLHVHPSGVVCRDGV
jgi:hypothetical protein